MHITVEMLTDNIITLSVLLGTNCLDGNNCQRCLSMYNSDIEVLGSSALGDEGAMLICEVRQLLSDDTLHKFTEFVENEFGLLQWDATSSTCDNWIVSAKQVAVYCVLVILEVSNYEGLCYLYC